MNFPEAADEQRCTARIVPTLALALASTNINFVFERAWHEHKQNLEDVPLKRYLPVFVDVLARGSRMCRRSAFIEAGDAAS